MTLVENLTTREEGAKKLAKRLGFLAYVMSVVAMFLDK
jgi:hypothetical protein